MQITGSHVNFTSDISKFYFIEKLACDDLFSSKLTRSVETNQVKKYVCGDIFAFSFKLGHAFVSCHFLSALATFLSALQQNRAQSTLINSPRITSSFQNKLCFQSE